MTAERMLQLKVITPRGTVYEGPVRSVVMPGVDGFIGVLPRHAPMVALLGPEVVRFRDGSGAEVRLAVSGGFAEVRGDRITLTAEAAERGDQIDLERALQAYARAQERLARHSREPEVDARRAELAMRRALARIHAVRPGLGFRQAHHSGKPLH